MCFTDLNLSILHPQRSIKTTATNITTQTKQDNEICLQRKAPLHQNHRGTTYTIKLNSINKTLHTRGKQTKNKLVNLLKDTKYINTITEHEHNENHTWFRKPVRYISKESQIQFILTQHNNTHKNHIDMA